MKLTYEQSLENFKKTFYLSGERNSAGKDVIPGGFSRRTFGYGPHAIFVDHGEGQYIYTIEGKKLLDLNNNFSVNILGQNHPAIRKALDELIPRGFSFGNPTDYEMRLAKVLRDRVESIEQVKFYCSASEACLGAIRTARGYTGKNKIAKFEGGYHGFTDDLANSAHPVPSWLVGRDTHPNALPDSAGIPKYKTDNVVMLVQNDFAACEKLLRDNADDTACVIMELQSCAGGTVVLDKDFVAKIRALTEELGILMIVDETISLRAAYGGLQSVYGVKPDMTIMGKMIGGGLPIGAVGASKKVYDVIEQNLVMISGTHHGHPLACAAGIACMETMDEAAYTKLNAMAERIKTELNTWTEENKYPFVVFGLYSVLGYAFTKELGQKITTHRDYWRIIDDVSMDIYALEMAVRGYFPVQRGQIGLTLPMTDEDITGYIETTKSIIRDIYD